MKNIKLSAEDIAKDMLIKIKNAPHIAKQFEINKRMAEGTISLDEVLVSQREVENSSPQGVEHEWDKLKKENPLLYDHEYKHYLARKKYGVDGRLYKIDDRNYYVFDKNYDEIIRKKSWTVEELRKIDMEILIAPHKDEEFLTSDRSLDILSYEVLNGTIKDLTLEGIEKGMKRYKWIASPGWIERYNLKPS